jgi:hypothetical protein
MSDRGRPPRLDPVGLLTVAAVVLVLLAGWWLFPRVQAYLAHEDCVATGRTNCGP